MSTGTEITRTEGQEIEQTRERTRVAPLVDIYENKDEILVVADMPGVSSENLNLNFENNNLVIRASTTATETGGSALFREFADVEFYRAFELAPGIDASAIEAKLTEGTLHIHLPKSAALKPRQIPITTE